MARNIVKTLFTKSEREEMRVIFNECKSEYFKALDIDTFSHDFTNDDLKDYIRKIYPNLNEDTLKGLVSEVTWEII